MIDVRKRPMCWMAIGFLLIICVIVLGRSEESVELKNSYLTDNEAILLEGTVVSKEYKESAYGGYWQVVCKNVRIRVKEEKQRKFDERLTGENGKTEIEQNKQEKLQFLVKRLEGKYLCQIPGKENVEIKMGQRVFLETKYVMWEKPTNEGQFDSGKYYLSQGVLGQFRKGKIINLGTDYDILREKMWQLRQKMQEILKKQLGYQDGGLIGAMLLGDKSDLSLEDKSLYQRNGISHILAISGLHLSMLGMGAYQVIEKVLSAKKPAAVLTIIFISLYCIFTGNSISTNRATIMFVLSLVAVLVGRSYDSLSALGFTAILQLFFNPYVLQNSGFLMSFLAVIGVTFLAPRLQQLFSCKKSLGKSLCVSLAATMTTLPVILTNYGTYPWYSVFLNLLVLPAMSLLLFCAILLLGIDGAITMIGNGEVMVVSIILNILKIVIKVLLKYFEICCEGFEKLFFHDGYLGAPGWIAICIYGIVILIAMSEKVVNSLFFRKLLILCGLSILTMRLHIGLEITLLDVGQGDGVVIRNSNGNVYISDCGSSSVSKVGQYRLLPFLKHKGYGKIKGIFISHLDSDHMNGIMELLEMAPREHVEIAHVFLPASVLEIEEDWEILKEVKSLAEINKAKIVYLSQGEEIQDGELKFSCLYPASLELKFSSQELELYSQELNNSLQESELYSQELNNFLQESELYSQELNNFLQESELYSQKLNFSSESIHDFVSAASEVDSYSKKLDRNNSSLVLMMRYGDFEMLFTGDVEQEGEREVVGYVLETEARENELKEEICEREQFEEMMRTDVGKQRYVEGWKQRLRMNASVDVLKVAHHGSSGSSCEEFLEVFQPKISLISCGKNNSYGHPHSETLERLENCETRICSTVDSGAITLKIRGNRVKIREYKK